MTTETLILGIDGGGTKTVAWLATWQPGATGGDTAVIGRGRAGASNPQSIGFDRAAERLERSVAAAFVDAGRTVQPVTAATIGLAGSDREEIRQQLRAWAERTELATRVRFVHDALPVLAAASQDGWGVALIAGTGSLAYGQATNGQTARSGGWGFLFGDEGSGFALGAAALRAVMQAADGRGPATTLSRAILNHCQISQPEGLITAIYRSKDPRLTLAGLAEVVTAQAQVGDAIARRIVEHAAGDLAGMVRAVAVRLDLADRPFPLACAGGVLVHSGRVADRLLNHLAKLGLQASPTVTVTDPVEGALRLAARDVAELPR
ncbi:MAG: N-acetylglucosamine kinase [Pirellulales bacterium]